MQCLFALSEDQRSRRCGEKHMSETVTGYIDHVIFRNEDNGYTVMVLKGTKKEEELTCVGSFPAITQGSPGVGLACSGMQTCLRTAGSWMHLPLRSRWLSVLHWLPGSCGSLEMTHSVS